MWTGASVSENDAVPQTVEVPGELRLSNPVPPPITVRLPIVAWPHGTRNMWLGLLFLPIVVDQSAYPFNMQYRSSPAFGER